MLQFLELQHLPGNFKGDSDMNIQESAKRLALFVLSDVVLCVFAEYLFLIDAIISDICELCIMA